MLTDLLFGIREAENSSQTWDRRVTWLCGITSIMPRRLREQSVNTLMKQFGVFLQNYSRVLLTICQAVTPLVHLSNNTDIFIYFALLCSSSLMFRRAL